MDTVGVLDDMPFPLRNRVSIVYRDVLYRELNHILVVLTEAYPEPGRVWTNFYNTGRWSGWDCNHGIALLRGDINKVGNYETFDSLINYPRVELKGYVGNNGVTPFTFELIQQSTVFEQGQVFNLSVPVWPGYMPYIRFSISGNVLSVARTGRINLATGEDDTSIYHTQCHITNIIGYSH